MPSLRIWSDPFVASAQVGFRHHKDYQAYIWAKGEHATQVCHTVKFTLYLVRQLNSQLISLCSCLDQVIFAEEDLPRDDCDYILGFYSHNMNSIVGLSTPIQVTKVRGHCQKESHLTASYDAFMNGYAHTYCRTYVDSQALTPYSHKTRLQGQEQ